MRSPRILVVLLTVAFATLGAGRDASAHPHGSPAPVSYDLDIRNDSVAVVLMVEGPVLEMWLGRPYEHPADEAGKEEAFAALRPVIDAHVDLEIDGAPARDGKLLRLAFLEAMNVPGLPQANDVLLIKVRYPASRPPDRVTITWKDFTGCLWDGEIQVPSMLESALDVEVGLMSPAEPVHTWWRPTEAGDWSDPAVAPTVPGWIERGLTRVALESALAGLGGVGGLLAFVMRHAPAEEPVAPAPPPASKDAAAAIFHDVLERMYRAFDGSNAEAREALAGITRPALLPALFRDLRELTILRDQGGVRGRVDRMRTRSEEVVLGSGPVPCFEVAWRGVVYVTAEHFGHAHRRAQVIDARYVLSADEGAWRVHDLQVTRSELFDADESGHLPDLGAEDDG